MSGGEGKQKKTRLFSDAVDEDELTKPAANKDARTRLRELRRENSKFRALVNASLQDIEEAAHDR